jgi:flavin reductase (DIM6/NTAB) family NADH-FMN oxidoreductase RutF
MHRPGQGVGHAYPAPEVLPLRQVGLDQGWARKYPEQVALAVTTSAQGEPDIITLGWVMPTSGTPPLCAISIGLTRHTHELLEQVPEFVLALPGEDLEEACAYCGTHSGRDVDKFKETGLTPLPALKVRPPLIAECLANLECGVVGRIRTGDHTIFVGEILVAHHSEQPGRRLFNLGGGRYSGL